VDAGGAGLCVVLDAWAAAIGGTTGTFEIPRPGRGLHRDDPVAVALRGPHRLLEPLLVE